MNNTPLVTVLMPVYNSEDVGKSIESVLNQTFKDFELLIIDNASTDDTVKIIKSYNDSRIRLVINETNIGPTGSLHKGIELAKGKYIARIDADDLMLPERLEKQILFMEENEDYGIVGSWTKHFDGQGNLSNTNKLCVTDKGVRAFMYLESPFYHPAVMIRTKVLRDNNINYDLSIRVAVEYKLWNDILNVSKGCNLNEVLTHYRVNNANSLTSKNNDTKVQEYYCIRKKICEQHHQDLMIKSIEIESKKKKNIFDIFKIYSTLRKYLNNNIFKDDKDYVSLNTCVNSRIYNSCVKENEGILKDILGFIFNIIK